MPLFEYKCKKCGATNEVLVRGSEKVHCPQCNSTRLEKLLSTFSSIVSSGNTPACDNALPSCSPDRCASGMCGMNRG